MNTTHKRPGDPAKFITRGNYDQHYGYARWLANGLDKLNVEPPKTGKELVELSASYMRPAPHSASWKRIEAEGRQKAIGLNTDFGKDMFAPITHVNYGVINPTRDSFLTPQEERDYYKTIARNYPEEVKPDGTFRSFTPRAFSYPVPGTKRELKLMQLGLACDVTDDKNNMFDGIVFKHPALTPETYNDFTHCMDVLLSMARGDAVPQLQKEDAVISAFWLMAQTTPARRGGTAHAKMVLEYMASEAGVEIPHTKQGYDLWAEAASTDLSKFKSGFKAGVFFDPAITSQDILYWQEEMLLEKSRPKDVKSSSATDMTGITKGEGFTRV